MIRYLLCLPPLSVGFSSVVFVFVFFAIPVPVRIWSEIWRFICDARGLCMGCLIFLGVFHVGCTGLLLSFFYFHLLGVVIRETCTL